MSDDAWTQLPLTDLSYQILLVLARRPLHGYGILRAISDRTDGRVEPDTGTLYTAIRRLNRDRLIKPDGNLTGPSRRGRRYRLTAFGECLLRLESSRLARLVSEARRLNLLDEEAGGFSGV